MDNSVSYMTLRQNYPLENSGLIVIYPTEFSISLFFIYFLVYFGNQNLLRFLKIQF